MGFSLMEAVMVVAIVAVIAAMALPRYAGAVANYRVKVAARRIAVDLDMLRSAAQQTSSSLTVSFDTANHRYTLEQLPQSDGSAADIVVDLREQPYGVTITSADFGGNTQVTFNGYGIPDHAGSVQVQLDGVTRQVTLDASGKEATP